MFDHQAISSLHTHLCTHMHTPTTIMYCCTSLQDEMPASMPKHLLVFLSFWSLWRFITWISLSHRTINQTTCTKHTSKSFPQHHCLTRVQKIGEFWAPEVLFREFCLPVNLFSELVGHVSWAATSVKEELWRVLLVSKMLSRLGSTFAIYQFAYNSIWHQSPDIHYLWQLLRPALWQFHIANELHQWIEACGSEAWIKDAKKPV